MPKSKKEKSRVKVKNIKQRTKKLTATEKKNVKGGVLHLNTIGGALNPIIATTIGGALNTVGGALNTIGGGLSNTVGGGLR